MSTSVLQLLWRLRTANRIVLAMLVVGLGMFAYDAWLGFRYWEGFSTGNAAQADVRALWASARGPSGAMPALEAEVAEAEALLERVGQRFSFAHNSEAIQLVAATARSNGLDLASVTIGASAGPASDPLSYGMLTLAIRVGGSSQSIQDFLAALSEAAPGMTVRSARLGSLTGSPWAVLDLDFLVDPVPYDGSDDAS